MTRQGRIARTVANATGARMAIFMAPCFAQRVAKSTPGWTCPECGRWFGKRQAHFCEPGTTAEAWFKGRPPALRKIYDAVARHVRKLGPVHIEAVTIGFLIKRKSTIAELRPRRVGFGLSFVLRRELNDARVTRRIAMTGGCVYHVVPITKPSEIGKKHARERRSAA